MLKKSTQKVLKKKNSLKGTFLSTFSTTFGPKKPLLLKILYNFEISSLSILQLRKRDMKWEIHFRNERNENICNSSPVVKSMWIISHSISLYLKKHLYFWWKGNLISHLFKDSQDDKHMITSVTEPLYLFDCPMNFLVWSQNKQR